MSYHGAVVNLPANVPVLQLSGPPVVYEVSSLGLIPITYRPQPVIQNLTIAPNPLNPFVSLVTPTSFLQEPFPNPLYISSCQGYVPSAPYPVYQYQQLRYQESQNCSGQHSQVSGSRDNQFLITQNPQGAVLYHQDQKVDQPLLKKYQGMCDASLPYFDQSDVSDSDSLEDISQIEKMISTSSALNDSGFFENSSEVGLEPNQSMSKQEISLKIEAAAAEMESETSSMDESSFSLHDESSSQDLFLEESDLEDDKDIKTYQNCKPSQEAISLENISTEHSGCKSNCFKFLEQATIDESRNRNLWLEKDNFSVKIARFLHANDAWKMSHNKEESFLAVGHDHLSEDTDSAFEYMTGSKFQDVHNMPRMNWNFDLKLVKNNGIFTYASACYMLSHSTCNSSKESLAAVRQGFADGKTSQSDDNSMMNGKESPQNVSLSRKVENESTSQSASATSSYQVALSISLVTDPTKSDSGCNSTFVASADGSHDTGLELDLDIFGGNSMPGTSSSASTISLTSLKNSQKLRNLEKSKKDNSKANKSYLGISVAQNNIRTSSGSKTNKKTGKKRKAVGMTDSYENVLMTKKRSLPSYKDKLVTSPKTRESTAAAAVDLEGKHALHPPPAPKKRCSQQNRDRGLCREVATPHTFCGERSCDAASTRSRARRRLVFNTQVEPLPRDEDEVFIIPRLLKKLFN